MLFRSGGGILGGAFAGYTLGLGKGVFAGVEVEGDITDVVYSTNASGVSTTRSQTTVYPGVGKPMTFSSNRTSPVTTGNIETKMNYQASAVGRLGYLLTPSLMVYGLAGGTYGSFTAAGADGQTPFDLWGWTVGTGVEKKLTSALGVRLEYRYSELSGGGVTRYTATSAGTISSSATAREDFGQQTHAVRAAVSVNF